MDIPGAGMPERSCKGDNYNPNLQINYGKISVIYLRKFQPHDMRVRIGMALRFFKQKRYKLC